jgi:hypothetical protein
LVSFWLAFSSQQSAISRQPKNLKINFYSYPDLPFPLIREQKTEIRRAMTTLQFLSLKLKLKADR